MWLGFEAFHLTRALDDENVHVYYRWMTDALWLPEGYTPREDLVRQGVDPCDLLEHADRVATDLLGKLGGKVLSRISRVLPLSSGARPCARPCLGMGSSYLDAVESSRFGLFL